MWAFSIRCEPSLKRRNRMSESLLSHHGQSSPSFSRHHHPRRSFEIGPSREQLCESGRGESSVAILCQIKKSAPICRRRRHRRCFCPHCTAVGGHGATRAKREAPLVGGIRKIGGPPTCRDIVCGHFRSTGEFSCELAIPSVSKDST